MSEVREIRPNCKVEVQQESMRLRVEYLTPADCRHAHDYWRTHLSAAHRPTNLLQVELPQPTTTPDHSPPVCSRFPDPEKKEDVDRRRTMGKIGQFCPKIFYRNDRG